MSKRANEFDRAIGGKIRARRMQLGLSLQHVAEALGLSYQQIQKYESGANRVAASRLHDLAKLLELDLLTFLSGYPFHQKEGGAWDAADGDEAVLLSKFRMIRSTKVRTQVLNLVCSLGK